MHLSRFPESSNSAFKQNTFFIYNWLPKTIGWLIACIFDPYFVNLDRSFFTTWFPFHYFILNNALNQISKLSGPEM